MSLRRLPFLFLAAAGTFVSGRAVSTFCVLGLPLRKVLGPWFPAIAAALALSAFACVAMLAREVLSPKRRIAGQRPFGLLRAWFVLAVACWVAFLSLVHPIEWPWMEAGVGIGFGLCAWATLLAGVVSRLPPRILRALDVLSFTLAASVLGLEVGLRSVAAIHPTQVLARTSDMPADVVRSLRAAPGSIHIGFPCNRGGHYDDEFVERKAGERLVVVIGDSFSFSIVPHDDHYTTVCERILGLPVDNMGIASTGPPEYLSLLVDEARPLDPDVVVIGLFVGNDLVLGRRTRNRWLELARPWIDRDSVLLWLVPRRLGRIAEERRHAGEGGLGKPPGEYRPRIEDALSLRRSMPWLADPLLEPGTFSEDGFRRLEVGRALQNCTAGFSALADCLGALRAIKNAAGTTRIAVMLIPDEFQVEDAVWEGVVADPRAKDLDRERPQKVMLPWLADQGFEVLDLLPLLRAAPPLADGRKHVYHLRDTHFNVRGNRIAGEALAEFLRPRLGGPARR